MTDLISVLIVALGVTLGFALGLASWGYRRSMNRRRYVVLTKEELERYIERRKQRPFQDSAGYW